MTPREDEDEQEPGDAEAIAEAHKCVCGHQQRHHLREGGCLFQYLPPHPRGYSTRTVCECDEWRQDGGREPDRREER